MAATSAATISNAANGHAAAPPSSVMNARRFIQSPRQSWDRGGTCPGCSRQAPRGGSGNALAVSWLPRGSASTRTAGSSSVRGGLVFRDHSLQIAVFVARDQANALQGREMLFGCGEIADRQIGLAHVLMCR